MKVTVFPGSLKQDQILIPPSKSMAHRALLCASLASGNSVIHHVDLSNDILATIEGMRLLGADIRIEGTDVYVTGVPFPLHCSQREVFCNESGSTLRFFLPLFSLTSQCLRFTGRNRLLKRPQKVYEDLFLDQGSHYLQTEEFIEIEGALKPGDITLRGDVSSQFISGLLFALVLQDQDSVIHILPPFESRSYVDLTLQMMKKFGVHAYFSDELTLQVPGSQYYHSTETTVESDYSQMAFFAALGCIDQPLTVRSMKRDSLQGDRQMLDIIEAMQGHFSWDNDAITFLPRPLKGCTIDMENCPDLGPVLMTLASYCEGETHMIHAGRLRYKESDRILAMETELKKVGVRIHSIEDEVWIRGPVQWKSDQILDGHLDHRIVMALSIGACKAHTPITISQAQAISKSYPGFFKDLQSLGFEIREEEE